MQINLDESLEQNLIQFKGSDIILNLKNGENIDGVLKDINSSLVHVEMLKGKDFYDSVVLLSEIASFTYKAR